MNAETVGAPHLHHRVNRRRRLHVSEPGSCIFYRNDRRLHGRYTNSSTARVTPVHSSPRARRSVNIYKWREVYDRFSRVDFISRSLRSESITLKGPVGCCTTEIPYSPKMTNLTYKNRYVKAAFVVLCGEIHVTSIRAKCGENKLRDK